MNKGNKYNWWPISINTTTKVFVWCMYTFVLVWGIHTKLLLQAAESFENLKVEGLYKIDASGNMGNYFTVTMHFLVLFTVPQRSHIRNRKEKNFNAEIEVSVCSHFLF